MNYMLFRGLLGFIITRGYGSVRPLREAFIAVSYLALQYRADVPMSMAWQAKLTLQRAWAENVIIYELPNFITKAFIVLRRVYQLAIKKDSSFVSTSYIKMGMRSKVSIKQKSGYNARAALLQQFAGDAVLVQAFQSRVGLQQKSVHAAILEVSYGR